MSAKPAIYIFCKQFCVESRSMSVRVWDYQELDLEQAGLSFLDKQLKQIQLYVMCGWLNRDGPLCSKCILKDFSPLIYSYLKCVPCKHSHYNWLKFVIIAFIPLTPLYFLALLFQQHYKPQHWTILYHSHLPPPSYPNHLVHIVIELHARGCRVLVCLWKPFY